MSVPTSKRDKSKVQFLDTALKLREYTIAKCKKIPKCYTFYISTRLSDLSADILEEVKSANSVYPVSQYEVQLRRNHFINAYCKCQSLVSEILVCVDLVPELVKCIPQWAELLDEEMKLIKGIMKYDRKRYSKSGLPDGVVTNTQSGMEYDILADGIYNFDLGENIPVRFRELGKKDDSVITISNLN